MRGIPSALLVSGALAFGAMTSSLATAGCYGDECGYRERPAVTHYESAPRTYERYAERPHYREYAPRYRTRYYERPTYHGRPSCYERPSCYDRPAVTTTYYSSSSYDGGYERPRYSSYSRPYYRKYYSSHYYRPHYRTARYGGGWTQTGYGSGYAYGGCHTAYIPYGWTWYRARSC